MRSVSVLLHFICLKGVLMNQEYWIGEVFAKLTTEGRKAVIRMASELLRSEEGRAQRLPPDRDVQADEGGGPSR